MAFQEIPAGADSNTLITLVNAVIRDLNNKEVTTVIKDTTGLRRVLMGKLPDGTYGVVISKAGFDVINQFS